MLPLAVSTAVAIIAVLLFVVGVGLFLWKRKTAAPKAKEWVKDRVEDINDWRKGL